MDVDVDGRLAWPLAGLILGAAIWYLWGNHGHVHGAENAATIAFSPLQYECYAWWRGQGHLGPKHFPHPERMLMNTSPQTLQEAEGTLSVAQSVVGNG